MKKYKVIKAIDIGSIHYSQGIVVYGEMDIVRFLKENNLIDKYLEEIKPELTYKPFSPKEEDDYFFIDTWGLVLDSVYYSSGKINKWQAESGNCFRTEEEAEYHRDWLIARKRIMDSLPSENAWENPKKAKWTIYYHHENKRLEITYWFHDQHGSLPSYKSQKEAKQAIQDLEDEYLVYFGIKRELKNDTKTI